MGTAFWIRRSLVVFAAVFAVLFVVSLLKGRGVEGGLAFSALWALITTAVFTVARVYQSRRGQACALCDDIPAEQDERAAQGA